MVVKGKVTGVSLAARALGTESDEKSPAAATQRRPGPSGVRRGGRAAGQLPLGDVAAIRFC